LNLKHRKLFEGTTGSTQRTKRAKWRLANNKNTDETYKVTRGGHTAARRSRSLPPYQPLQSQSGVVNE
jgi:hypothetical protein